MKELFIFFLFLFFLCSCELKRFKQDNYNCEANNLKIENINIIKTNSIKKGYVLMEGFEYEASIDLYNKNEIYLSLDAINIKINKNKKEIVATFKENIYFLNCEVTNFKI